MAESTSVGDFHPDLKGVARFLPRAAAGPRTLRLARALAASLSRSRSDAEIVDLSTGVRVRLFRPAEHREPVPALLWMHPGGFVMGQARLEDDLCARWSQSLGIVVASVEYRLAPEHPYPAPLEDCYAAFIGLAGLAEVDPARMAIGGASAGGGLAASLSVLCRERNELQPVFQMLAYPMLDDRTVCRNPELARKVRLWNESSNRFGWRCYLGDADPDLAVPARQSDLFGLPPAWIGVGTLDLFHDESMAYAQRLRNAGVSCDVEEIPGAFHAFDSVAPNAEVSKAFFASQAASLAAHLGAPGGRPVL